MLPMLAATSTARRTRLRPAPRCFQGGSYLLPVAPQYRIRAVSNSGQSNTSCRLIASKGSVAAPAASAWRSTQTMGPSALAVARSFSSSRSEVLPTPPRPRTSKTLK
jgi:hypothetical protein